MQMAASLHVKAAITECSGKKMRKSRKAIEGGFSSVTKQEMSTPPPPKQDLSRDSLLKLNEISGFSSTSRIDYSEL